MTSILDKIVVQTRADVGSRKQEQSTEILMQLVHEKQAELPPNPGENFLQAIQSKTARRFVLEIKPSSPSAGVLTQSLDLDAVLKAYERYGNALSVLTDKPFFGGGFDLLKAVTTQTRLPALCKDFIIDPYQVLEARLAGASAVLLIVKILKQNELADLHRFIESNGMVPVVEVQTECELNMALSVSPRIILINNRNLDTFEIDFETTTTVAAKIPNDITIISASGIKTPEDLDQLGVSCHTFLIGSSLMSVPVETLDEILGNLVGRASKPEELRA